jgi:2-polyprenyl-3-methyl-5-hydroxy-6-metoxy-1,4-benzoquinol methylase
VRAERLGRLTGVHTYRHNPVRRWNHNLHYHRIVLAAIPPGAQRALDVGCGEACLAQELSARIPHVVALDRDAASIEGAQQRAETTPIEFVEADFLEHEFPAGSFDLVASVAALHHLPMQPALVRMAELLRPGGVLAVVGLARSQRRPSDLVAETAGAILHQVYRRTRHYVEQTAPVVWPPPVTYRQAREIAEQTLPGVRYRRHALWRYSLVWTKP